MKRARPAPDLFGTDSDSSSAPKAPPSGSIKKHEAFPAPQHLRNRHSSTALDNRQNAQPEEDSLDVFMSTLDKPAGTAWNSAARPDPDSESSQEGFMPAATARVPPDEQIEGNLDEGTNPRQTRLARDLVLEPLDHAQKTYPSIASCGYIPSPHLESLSRSERAEKIHALGASLHNADGVVPVDSFEDLAHAIPEPLLELVLSAYTRPTPVQRVAIPAALHGRSVIGVAKTGSGKTAAYALPLLCHVHAQPIGTSTRGGGPRAVVIAPTRELATQISEVVSKFGKGIEVGVMCVVGGHTKYEQFKRLRDGGAEVVVCTPGRFIDMIKMKACSLARCSYVVLDEADRMFDMGFGPQVDALLSQIRPDAQKLLFSATFPRNVAALARQYVQEPCKVVIGQAVVEGEGEGNREEKPLRKMSARSVPMVSDTVAETYVAVESEGEKEAWLVEHLDELIREGLVIVFCQSRGAAATVANMLRANGRPAACVHGETEAADRTGLLRLFRRGEIPVLVTTDLSARGLDIANVASVVNIGGAKSWEWHVHRVGRTGRAEQRGNAYTLLWRGSRKDVAFMGDAVAAYKSSQLRVPQVLNEMWGAEKESKREVRSGGRGQRGRRRLR